MSADPAGNKALRAVTDALTEAMTVRTHRHWIGRHTHPDWHGHCDPTRRGFKPCDRPHWHVWWRHPDHVSARTPGTTVGRRQPPVTHGCWDLVAGWWTGRRRCRRRDGGLRCLLPARHDGDHAKRSVGGFDVVWWSA